MRDNLFKDLAKALYFRQNAVRRIWFGPLRGMRYKVDDITGLAAWYSGNEREHQKVFKKLIETGDTVVNVGANWGVHTLFFSKLVGLSGSVIAFEPLPEAMRDLRWHLSANNCSNVRTIESAASDEDGEAFFTIGESAYTGALAEVRPSWSQEDRLRVRTTRLDTVVESLNINRVKLIKIDVEGSESKVLLGARKTIERYRPHLVIDLHTPDQDISVAGLTTSWELRLVPVTWTSDSSHGPRLAPF